LPESLAERFASIDYRSHLALLAEVFENGRETMIGEARYVVDARDPETCELAIAVANNGRRPASPALSSTAGAPGRPIGHPQHGRGQPC
jgi:hypothetical protein